MKSEATSFAEKHYRDRLFDLLTPSTEWLDLGCGRQLLPGWLKHSHSDQQVLSTSCRRLTGADLAFDDIARHPHLQRRVICNLHSLPFQDNSFSLLTARSVVEHIEEPESFLRESLRVLSPGGLLLFATPNLLYYQCLVASVTPEIIKKPLVRYLEGRSGLDVFKTYYRLNVPLKVKRLASQVGFTVQRIETVESLPEFTRLGWPIQNLEKALTRALRNHRLSAFRAVIVALLQKPLHPGYSSPS